MAVKTATRNPIDSGGPLKLDVADQIDLVAPERDTPLLHMIGFGASAEEIASATIGADSLDKDCTSTTHTWLNDNLVPTSGTITANYTAAGGTITVGTTQVLYFRVNDVFKIFSAPSTEGFYLVTAINTGAGTMTVTEISGQSHTNGDPWVLLGNAQRIAGSANTTGKWTTLTQTSNFTQIMQEDVFVSGTEESVEQYGITDPTAREISKTFQRLIVQFEKAAHYGYRGAIGTNISTDPGARFGGLFYFLRVASGGLNTNMGGDPISEKALDDQIDVMWRAGGYPDTLLCNSVGFREMRKFLRPYVQTDRTERTAGLVISSYESAVGINLDIVLDRHLGDGDYVLISKNQLGIGPLRGNGNNRAFVAREVPWQGDDARHVNIRGEYTMEVKNNTTHHSWMYGAATTVSS